MLSSELNSRAKKLEEEQKQRLQKQRQRAEKERILQERVRQGRQQHEEEASRRRAAAIAAAELVCACHRQPLLSSLTSGWSASRNPAIKCRSGSNTMRIWSTTTVCGGGQP